MPNAHELDAYAPTEIAARVQSAGVAKVRRDAQTLFVLSVLAGAFISLGALLFATVVTGSQLGFGLTRLIGGVAFSLGLVLVVVAGAELFTGNNLAIMAWASGLVRGTELARHFAIVYVGNAAGALGTVALAYAGGVHRLGDGAVGKTLLAIGTAKAGLSPLSLLALGVLCNALVCLAVWLCFAGHTVTDKILAIVPPIAGFVAMGLEHSIANMFFLPYAVALDGTTGLVPGALVNLGLVTVGNLVGGGGLVALVYWLAFLRGRAAR